MVNKKERRKKKEMIIRSGTWDCANLERIVFVRVERPDVSRNLDRIVVSLFEGVFDPLGSFPFDSHQLPPKYKGANKK